MKGKLQLARIVILGIAVVATVFSIRANSGSGTAYAVGDLTVNWGVPEPNPIFTINNMAPGQCEIRTVNVTNNAPITRQVGVRGLPTDDNDNLSSVLEITIDKNGTDVYGPQTLTQFFTNSLGADAVLLSNQTSGEAANYHFEVCFQQTAGNSFQNTNVVFNLNIGIAVPVPNECSGITFSGNPIYGTAYSDSLKGTAGNDLIFGLEGSDSIDGRGGDDCIVGGAGSDSLKGKEGNDVLLGESGSDSLDGGLGNDKLYGGDDSDSLSGGPGNDRLFGGAGADSLKGVEGDDYLDGGDGSDSLKGEAGTDTCLNGESTKTCEI